MLPAALEKLVVEFGKLPGIGPRTAERLAFYVLKSGTDNAQSLAAALNQLHESIQICQQCYNLSESELCTICKNPARDPKVLAIVEEALDVIALEKTNMFHGLYHVLGGVISPIDGVGPDQLSIKSLIKRVKDTDVNELIIATNPTTEGEATALYIQKQLPPTITITRLARGLPIGSDLEYADQITLGRALEGRQIL